MPDEGKTLGRRMMQRIIRWREGFRETRMPASGRLIGDYLKGCAEELPEDCEKVVIQASNDTIAKKTETSIKTVQNNLRLMEEKQLIRRNPVGGRAGEGRQQPNEIELLLPEEEGDPVDKDERQDAGPPARAGPKKKSRGAIALRLHPVG
jgi:hypothetical protein